MNGINRFDLNKVVEQPATPQTAAVQTQTTANVSSAFMSDSIETYQPEMFDPPSEDPRRLAEKTAATDLVPPDLTNAVSTRVDTTQQKFDALSLLIDELSKTPPDQQAMFNALQSLTPDDRKAVLEQLASQGKSPDSDLDKLVQVMYQNGNSVNSQAMGDLLATLARDVHNDPSEGGLFSQIYGDCLRFGITDGGESSGQTILNFLKDLSMDMNPDMSEILKSLPADPLEYMQGQFDNYLSSHFNSPDSDALSLNQELVNAYFLAKGYSSDQAAQYADQDLTRHLDSIPQYAPNYGELLAQFPEWGMNKLVELSANPSQFSQMIQSFATQNPQTVAALLKELTDGIAQNGSNKADLSNVCRQILTTLRSLQQSSNGAGGADDIIRSFVNSLGPDAAEVLGELPVNLLLQMNAILQNGDDSSQNSAFEYVLGQAVANAEH
jgi:hypothetical protein